MLSAIKYNQFYYAELDSVSASTLYQFLTRTDKHAFSLLLPSLKAQITAYVEYFAQFTSEQFPEDISEVLPLCFCSDSQAQSYSA